MSFELHYYSRDGVMISMDEFVERFENFNYRKVVQSEITDGDELVYRVSTVWLGIDHGFSENGPPLIFETMAFGPDSYRDLVCHRYPDEATAIKGHRDAVLELCAGLRTPSVRNV